MSIYGNLSIGEQEGGLLFRFDVQKNSHADEGIPFQYKVPEDTIFESQSIKGQRQQQVTVSIYTSAELEFAWNDEVYLNHIGKKLKVKSVTPDRRRQSFKQSSFDNYQNKNLYLPKTIFFK